MIRMKEILLQQKLGNDKMLHDFIPKFNRPELEPFRPCEADGKPAIFHRWVQEDKALLQMESRLPFDVVMEIKRDFNLHGFAPANAKIEKISQTFALVEYEDGTVRKVEPEVIQFTDKVQWHKPEPCPVTPEQFNAIYEDEEGEQ